MILAITKRAAIHHFFSACRAYSRRRPATRSGSKNIPGGITQFASGSKRAVAQRVAAMAASGNRPAKSGQLPAAWPRIFRRRIVAARQGGGEWRAVHRWLGRFSWFDLQQLSRRDNRRRQQATSRIQHVDMLVFVG